MQIEAVNALGVVTAVALGILIFCDHLFAAARIAGERRAGKGKVLRDNAACDERINRGNEAARVAARVGNAPGAGDRGAVRLGQLRKAVIPVRVGAVCGRCIDHTGMVVFDQRDSFLRCGIRQAQEHDVRRIQKLSALLGILALVLVDEQQLYVVAFAETLVDLKAGRALLAVNINLRFAHNYSSSSTSATNFSILSIWRVTSCGAGPPMTLRPATQVRRSSAS